MDIFAPFNIRLSLAQWQKALGHSFIIGHQVNWAFSLVSMVLISQFLCFLLCNWGCSFYSVELFVWYVACLRLHSVHWLLLLPKELGSSWSAHFHFTPAALRVSGSYVANLTASLMLDDPKVCAPVSIPRLLVPVVCGVCMCSCGYMHMGSTLLSVAVIKYHNQKQLSEENIYFLLQHSPAWEGVREVVWRGNLEVGTEAEVMEECCLLSCSPWLTQLAFPTTQSHLPRDDTIHGGLSPLTLIIN